MPEPNRWNLSFCAPLTDRAFSAVVAAVSSKLWRGGEDRKKERNTRMRMGMRGGNEGRGVWTACGLNQLRKKKADEARAVSWCEFGRGVTLQKRR